MVHNSMSQPNIGQYSEAVVVYYGVRTGLATIQTAVLHCGLKKELLKKRWTRSVGGQSGLVALVSL